MFEVGCFRLFDRGGQFSVLLHSFQYLLVGNSVGRRYSQETSVCPHLEGFDLMNYTGRHNTYRPHITPGRAHPQSQGHVPATQDLPISNKCCSHHLYSHHYFPITIPICMQPISKICGPFFPFYVLIFNLNHCISISTVDSVLLLLPLYYFKNFSSHPFFLALSHFHSPIHQQQQTLAMSS